MSLLGEFASTYGQNLCKLRYVNPAYNILRKTSSAVPASFHSLYASVIMATAFQSRSFSLPTRLRKESSNSPLQYRARVSHSVSFTSRFRMVSIGSPRRCRITNRLTLKLNGGLGKVATSWKRGNLQEVIRAKMSARGYQVQPGPTMAVHASCVREAVLRLGLDWSGLYKRESLAQALYMFEVIFQSVVNWKMPLFVQSSAQGLEQLYCGPVGTELHSDMVAVAVKAVCDEELVVRERRSHDALETRMSGHLIQQASVPVHASMGVNRLLQWLE